MTDPREPLLAGSQRTTAAGEVQRDLQREQPAQPAHDQPGPDGYATDTPADSTAAASDSQVRQTSARKPSPAGSASSAGSASVRAVVADCRCADERLGTVLLRQGCDRRGEQARRIDARGEDLAPSPGPSGRPPMLRPDRLTPRLPTRGPRAAGSRPAGPSGIPDRGARRCRRRGCVRIARAAPAGAVVPRSTCGCRLVPDQPTHGVACGHEQSAQLRADEARGARHEDAASGARHSRAVHRSRGGSRTPGVSLSVRAANVLRRVLRSSVSGMRAPGRRESHDPMREPSFVSVSRAARGARR